MAVQMILHLEGIAGESKKDGNEDEIDISSWSFGMSQSGTWHTGGGGGGGIVNMQDITLTKLIDASSCDLMAYCSKGDHIPTGSLTVYKVGGTNLDYYKIDLEKIIISSVQTSGTAGGDDVVETVSLNFAVVKIKYKKQGDDGGSAGEFEMGFNVETNVAV